MRTTASVLLVALGLAACGPDKAKRAHDLTGGDAEAGRVAIRHYGCGSCHDIPGTGGEAKVGPSLAGIGARSYLAGSLPNTPENMVRWIRDPQGVRPGTVMPEMNVNETDGRDIAAYLYTLQ